jgi:hypothetical protein
MIIATFFVMTQDGFMSRKSEGRVAFSGNIVKKIVPPKGTKVSEIYGKVLFMEDPELEDFFIILRNQTIFPLPIIKYGSDTVSKIMKHPEFASEVESLKLLISFVRL